MTSQTEREYAEFESSRTWIETFQRLKNETSVAMFGNGLSTSYARDPENRRKNRYRDVSPYDHSRVVLHGESDYINASLIEVPEANRKYILTQGPLDHTICDFWRMTWEQKSQAVIMLNRVIEKGTLKCSQYWPLGSDYGSEDELYIPEYGLRILLKKDLNMGHFYLRKFALENLETQETREVLHFHYMTWPDFGIPDSPNSFLYFLHAVRESGSLESSVGPAIIHCSAGIGRSGTFCLVDSCLVMVEKKSTLECIEVRESLIKMRSYRMGLIQTSDQLKFSYQSIIHGASAILRGAGLGSLDPSSESNEMETLPPQPPGRSSSLRPHLNVQIIQDSTDSEPEYPPPIPPKKKDLKDFDQWGEEEDEEDEDYDVLVDRMESDEIDSSEEGEEEKHEEEEDEGEEEEEGSDQERQAAELRQQIREQRKLETMEKIRLMKERQKNSERCRPSGSFWRPKLYFGLAVLVGLAGVAVYKYFY